MGAGNAVCRRGRVQPGRPSIMRISFSDQLYPSVTKT